MAYREGISTEPGLLTSDGPGRILISITNQKNDQPGNFPTNILSFKKKTQIKGKAISKKMFFEKKWANISNNRKMNEIVSQSTQAIKEITQ